jgi:hypothetical protein
MDLFRLNTATLVVSLIVVLAGSVAVGVLIGRTVRERPGTRHEPAGVAQGALLGLVGLLLAFGLSMAVDRYEGRRALVVQEANDIGTTYLRAQMLPEPQSARSLDLLVEYTNAAIEVADAVPGSESYRVAVARVESLQDDLWTLAREAVETDPVGTGPRLYTETLNAMFDTHTSRIASLGNRVPTPVMVLLVLASAIALGALAYYLTLLGKGLTTSLVTAAVVLVILFVSFDLDRPRRGFIQVPDAPLVQLLQSFG